MMKKTVSVFITLMAGLSTGFAQRSIEIIPFDPAWLTGSPEVRRNQGGQETPLATAQRCTAAANYLDGILYDTVRHYYSGLRGTQSRKDFTEPANAHDSVIRTDTANGTVYLGSKVRYDNQDRFIHGDYYSHRAPHDYIGSDTARYNSTGVRTFYESDIDNPGFLKQYILTTTNDAGKVIKDSLYQNAYSNNFNWTNAHNYAYDVNNRQTLHTDYTSYNNFTSTFLRIIKSFYNGNSNLPQMDSVLEITNNNINAASRQAIYYFYNANQQLINDTTYNQIGNPMSAKNHQYTGNVLTVTTYHYNNGSWNQAGRTVTKKNNDGFKTHYEQQIWTGAQGWKTISGDSAVFNAAGYVLEKIRYTSSNNNISVVDRQTVVRNSFNNPTMTLYKTYDQQGVLVSERKGLYYYTEYEDGTGIADRTKKLEVLVFPNPAINKVQVSIKDAVKQFHLKMIDLSGKVVLQRSFQATTSEIDLTPFAPGVYQLVISTKDSNAAFTGKLLKQ